MKKDKLVKWEPTPKATRPTDGIKSSSYTNSKPFIPSYEKTEDRPQIGLLLSMEYAKIWRRERDELDKPVVKDGKYLPKSYVIRGLNKKKQNLKENNKENQNAKGQSKTQLKPTKKEKTELR